jgi:hypothetical protein
MPQQRTRQELYQLPRRRSPLLRSEDQAQGPHVQTTSPPDRPSSGPSLSSAAVAAAATAVEPCYPHQSPDTTRRDLTPENRTTLVLQDTTSNSVVLPGRQSRTEPSSSGPSLYHHLAWACAAFLVFVAFLAHTLPFFASRWDDGCRVVDCQETKLSEQMIPFHQSLVRANATLTPWPELRQEVTAVEGLVSRSHGHLQHLRSLSAHLHILYVDTRPASRTSGDCYSLVLGLSLLEQEVEELLVERASVNVSIADFLVQLRTSTNYQAQHQSQTGGDPRGQSLKETLASTYKSLDMVWRTTFAHEPYTRLRQAILAAIDALNTRCTNTPHTASWPLGHSKQRWSNKHAIDEVFPGLNDEVQRLYQDVGVPRDLTDLRTGLRVPRVSS